MPDEPANLKVAARSSSIDLQEGSPTCKPVLGWTGTACPSTCRGPSARADSPSPSPRVSGKCLFYSVSRVQLGRPSGLAGYVQRWHRQPEVLPQIDQVDTRSQRHSGMSQSCFLVSELGVIECQVHPSSTKIVFRTITIGAVSEVRRRFLFVLSQYRLDQLVVLTDRFDHFPRRRAHIPFFTRLRRRTSPSQSSRAGPLRQVQKVAARSRSHGKMSSPCELD